MHSPRLGLPVPHRKMSPQLMSTAGTPQQAGQAHGDLLVGLSEELPPPLPTPLTMVPMLQSTANARSGPPSVRSGTRPGSP